jgi:hypothetical protein
VNEKLIAAQFFRAVHFLWRLIKFVCEKTALMLDNFGGFFIE